MSNKSEATWHPNSGPGGDRNERIMELLDPSKTTREEFLAALSGSVPRNDHAEAMTHAWQTAARERDEARAERDALAYVIEQVRQWDEKTRANPVLGYILSTAPAVSLARHDAEVWDEGYEVGNEDQYGSATPGGQPYDPTPNPHRFPTTTQRGDRQ